ncbi:hypothetical protein [Mycobacteroides abscessus]|uniref:hypothetical protein n=1 Tax=Mycobacteroides abscessus TaxID=36809 RepID=UPI00160003A0|nr:hypothetical protein [Mycobacteroides abscessus]
MWIYVTAIMAMGADIDNGVHQPVSTRLVAAAARTILRLGDATGLVPDLLVWW